MQMRAARALLGIDQRKLSEMSGVSLPTIQRMEASGGNVRGVVDTLIKVTDAFDAAGIELIGDRMPSTGTGRGVRLREVSVKPAQSFAPSDGQPSERRFEAASTASDEV